MKNNIDVKKKVKNPEEKLLQSVMRDAKLKIMEENSKVQADIVNAAKWEVLLHLKDEKSKQKRIEEQASQDFKLSSQLTKSIRKEKLENLYLNDQILQDQELKQMGRERI
jgi:hypothetical protein